MVATTPNYLLAIPPAGDPTQTNIWGTMENTGRSLVDTALGGVLPLSITGGDLVLTSNAAAADQSRNAHFNFSGTLTSDELVLWPSGCGRMFSVTNGCTGAFDLTLGVNDGTGTGAAGTTLIVPQGTTLVCRSDGTNIAIRHTGLPPTRQVLTSGSGATYTTPGGCVQIRVRMAAGGAGGGQNANGGADGSSGNTTSFNGITVLGGTGGHGNGNPGAGGTGGSNTPSSGSVAGLFRVAGNAGGTGVNATAATSANGGNGGSGPFGGGPIGAASGATNSGSGGGGESVSSSAAYSGGGGGAGEYVEFIINNPAGTYTYTVGAAVSGAVGAGNGAAGVILVDEEY